MNEKENDIGKMDIGQIIEEETVRRLVSMERTSHQFPPKAGFYDYYAIIALILFCVILIIGCMTGVIV